MGGYSLFILVMGWTLPCLGIGIVCYLLKVYLEFSAERRGVKKVEPEYVREINKRLRFNNVETERDLL